MSKRAYGTGGVTCRNETGRAAERGDRIAIATALVGLLDGSRLPRPAPRSTYGLAGRWTAGSPCADALAGGWSSSSSPPRSSYKTTLRARGGAGARLRAVLTCPGCAYADQLPALVQTRLDRDLPRTRAASAASPARATASRRTTSSTRTNPHLLGRRADEPRRGRRWRCAPSTSGNGSVAAAEVFLRQRAGRRDRGPRGDARPRGGARRGDLDIVAGRGRVARGLERPRRRRSPFHRLPRQRANVARTVFPSFASWKQVKPAVVDEAAHALVPGDDAVHLLRRRLDEDVESQRLVNENAPRPTPIATAGRPFRSPPLPSSTPSPPTTLCSTLLPEPKATLSTDEP